MKNVFTFIFVVLVILGCGKTNRPSTTEKTEAVPMRASVDTKQESTSQRKISDPDAKPEDYRRELALMKSADPDAKPEDYRRELTLMKSADPDAKPEDYSEYLSPEQSMQWLKQNGFTIEKQYSGRYILTYTRSVFIIIPIDRSSIALVPSHITLNNLEVVLAVDTNNNIRVKRRTQR